MQTNPVLSTAGPQTQSTSRQLFNKVPEITVWFWIIKVLCTTVGETFSDFLNLGTADGGQLGWGVPKTAGLMTALLIIALVLQMRSHRYHPARYWAAVVLVSIVGTLVTDWLHDDKGVSLVTTTIIFTALLAAVFGIWFALEKTLSIHSVFKGRREAFYWLVVLVTFALGTSGGDLLSEKVNLGYVDSVLAILGAVVAVGMARFIYKSNAVMNMSLAHVMSTRPESLAAHPGGEQAWFQRTLEGLQSNAVLTFWLAYILTRPLGGNTGDLISQSSLDGLGLGTTATTLIFLGVILVAVIYLSITRVDATENQEPHEIEA